jgi:hypothetical protein
MRRLWLRLIVAIALVPFLACATLAPSPNDSEIQQTRKLAIQIFQAVELAGTTLEGVQVMEIGLYEQGKVTAETHRAFQTRLLVTARVVRAGLKQIQMATRMPELRNTVQAIIDSLNELKTEFAPQFAAGPVGTGLSLVVSSLSVLMVML